MYQLVAKKKRSGVELLDSTLSKWREIIPDTPVEKIGEEISGKTKEGVNFWIVLVLSSPNLKGKQM